MGITSDVQLYPAKPQRSTAELDSDVELALSTTGPDPLRRLATSSAAVVPETLRQPSSLVQLERARADSAPEEGYVELWERAEATQRSLAWPSRMLMIEPEFYRYLDPSFALTGGGSTTFGLV